ncbi:hypothetical protein GGS21DRAFT_328361 [Xylaria nigripes]|nr:hypothetical protein GGS21DRAFT_328361 [Xylaria nigripes]
MIHEYDGHLDINLANFYLQIPDSLGDHPTASQMEKLSAMLAGFDIIAREDTNDRDLIDVEEPLWRIHLHPSRMERAFEKERQDARHGVFSLGMVIVEVRFWTYLTRFRNSLLDTAMKQQEYFCQGHLVRPVPDSRQYRQSIKASNIDYCRLSTCAE